MTPPLHWFGIVEPAPQKTVWVALLLISAALKLSLAVRSRRMIGLAAYLYVSALVALLPRNSRLAPPMWPTFGAWPEAALALALTLFVAETLYCICLHTDREGGRRILRTSAGTGLLLASVTWWIGVPPYAGYPSLPYYLRLDSSLAALALLGGATWHLYRWQYRIPRVYAANAVCGFLLLAPVIVGGLQQSRLPDRADLWVWRIGLELWSIAVLTGWHFTITKGKVV